MSNSADEENAMTQSPDVVGKVAVDYDLCEANGICVGIDPDVFQLDDDDNLHLLSTDVTEANEARILQAVDSCPRNALRIERNG
ncbi:MAG: ferredoxin [Actinomycetota bacterium]